MYDELDRFFTELRNGFFGRTVYLFVYGDHLVHKKQSPQLLLKTPLVSERTYPKSWVKTVQ
jgi:hypothetical protein